jgi:hypothetical protein
LLAELTHGEGSSPSGRVTVTPDIALVISRFTGTVNFATLS